MLNFFLYFLVGSITVAVVYLSHQHIVTFIARRNAVSQFGCKPPAAYPHRDPILGLDAVKDALRAVKSKTSIARQIDQYDRYGTTFSSKFFMTGVINTVDPENVKEVLSTRFSDYSIGSRRKNAFSPLLGRSIFQVDGLQWKHSRNIVQSCLTKSQAEDVSLIDEHVTNLLDVLSQNSGRVDLGDWLPRLTADVTTDCFFGSSIGSLKSSENFQEGLFETIHDAQVGCEERWKMGILADVLPHRGFKENVRRVHGFMDQYVHRAMELRRTLSEEPQKSEKTHDHLVFLHQLSRVTDDWHFIRDELLTVFFAGVDTAAALLTNLFFILAKRPDIWQQLRDEVHPLMGKRPTISQLRSFKHHRNCLMECKARFIFLDVQRSSFEKISFIVVFIMSKMLTAPLLAQLCDSTQFFPIIPA